MRTGNSFINRWYTGHLCLYSALGTFSFSSLEPVIIVHQAICAADNLKITRDHWHNYRLSVFQNRNRVLVQDNAPCHMARNLLDLYQEYIIELQLTSNHLTRRILILEHISGVIQLQHRAQKQPFLNFVDIQVEELIKFISDDLPRTSEIHAKAVYSWFENKILKSTLLDRWS